MLTRLPLNKYVALAMLVLVLLALGTPYLYGAYLPQLMQRLGLDASASAALALATNIGLGLGGLPAGVLIDAKGPHLLIFFGSFCLFLGYFCVYLCYTYTVANMALLSLAMGTMGFGCVLSFYACVKAASVNFPDHKGTAGALPVSAYGLSAVAFSSIAAKFFSGNTGGLLRFLAIACGALAFVGSFFVRLFAKPVSYLELPVFGLDLLPVHSRSNSFKNLTSVYDMGGPSDRRGSSGSGSGVLTPPVSAPVPVAADTPARKRPSLSLRGSFVFFGIGLRLRPPSVIDETTPLTETLNLHRLDSSANIARELNDLDTFKLKSLAWHNLLMLFHLRLFLMHYPCLLFAAAVGQMYIYSVGYVVTAQAFKHHNGPALLGGPVLPGLPRTEAAQALQVLVLSVCNFSGRLVAGTLLDLAVKRLKIQRMWVSLAGISLLLTGQFLAVLVDLLLRLWVVSAVVGSAYGLTFGLYPAVIADVFGTLGFSTAWGLICTGPLICLFGLNYYFGWNYDQQLVVDPELGSVCFQGLGCYRDAFITTEGVCFLAGVAALVIIYIQRQH